VVTEKEYRIECGRLLLTGEWLPLQYLSAMLGREQGTIKTWTRLGLVTCKDFGRKRTNLYNVEEAFKADRERPRNPGGGRRRAE
jgi:hypothetical protein